MCGRSDHFSWPRTCGWWKCPRPMGGSWSGGGGERGGPPGWSKRARIVLLAAEGVPGKQLAAIVGCAEPTVVTWRGRYAERGLAGLEDLPRPGKPAQLPEALRDRVLELTLTEPPDQFGATHWSSRLLAAALA